MNTSDQDDDSSDDSDDNAFYGDGGDDSQEFKLMKQHGLNSADSVSRMEHNDFLCSGKFASKVIAINFTAYGYDTRH
ncbi:hypothetical protein OAN61_01110 [bacterium]|nr:hypothetical protein [bacterium]